MRRQERRTRTLRSTHVLAQDKDRADSSSSGTAGPHPHARTFKGYWMPRRSTEAHQMHELLNLVQETAPDVWPHTGIGLGGRRLNVTT